jgi:hypothetical protein
MRSIIGVIASCEDCSWRDENYHTATKSARNHARNTVHKVTVETTYTHTYNEQSKIEAAKEKVTHDN